MPKPKRILISAFIGSENLGDEAIFKAFIGQLAERLKMPRLTASSVNPDRTRSLLLRQHHKRLAEVEVAHRAWLPLTILRNDVCIFGGGGIIQDQSSILNLIYFLLQIQYAKLVRKKVVLAFVGIGPINSRIGRICTKLALSGIRLCIVRDQASEQLLDDLQVAGTEIICASDIALSQQCHSDRRSADATKQEYVLLSLRHWYNQSRRITAASLKSGQVEPGSRLDTLLSELAKGLMTFLEANAGFHVLAVPCFGQRDNLVHSALLRKLDVPYRDRFRIHSQVSDPCQYVNLAGSASCVISMRLHALVLASLQAVPMVALSYSPKVAAFMAQLGLSNHVLDIESDPQLDRIAIYIEEALREAAHIRDRVQREIRKLRDLNDAALAKLVKSVEG